MYLQSYIAHTVYYTCACVHVCAINRYMYINTYILWYCVNSTAIQLQGSLGNVWKGYNMVLVTHSLRCRYCWYLCMLCTGHQNCILNPWQCWYHIRSLAHVHTCMCTHVHMYMPCVFGGDYVHMYMYTSTCTCTCRCISVVVVCGGYVCVCVLFCAA